MVLMTTVNKKWRHSFLTVSHTILEINFQSTFQHIFLVNRQRQFLVTCPASPYNAFGNKSSWRILLTLYFKSILK